MSKHESSRRSSSRASRSARVRPIDPSDPKHLQVVARREAELIAAALKDARPLDRAAMGAELFPFNDAASAQRVAAVIETLVRQRIPGNPWNAVHKPLCKTDQSGDGYCAWIDAFRDAAFLVGVDYALRWSFPEGPPKWWADYQQLDARTRDAIGVMVRYAGDPNRSKGGAR